MTQRDFEAELREARPIAARITADLAALGVEHKPIDVERAGMLALVETLDGEQLGDMISLGGKSKDDLLRDVRYTLATAAARAALGVKAGGHFNQIQEMVVSGQSVANWMAEIWFDGDESRYALVGEYIKPIVATPGWRRSYSVYQAKADTYCDVPDCRAHWHNRKEASGGYAVHVCRKHQALDADDLFYNIHHRDEEVG